MTRRSDPPAPLRHEDASFTRTLRAVLAPPSRTSDVPPTTHLRSTWITASLDLLATRGLREAHLAHVDSAHRDALVTAVAGSWLPEPVARAHYQAMVAMGVPEQDAFTFGRALVPRLGPTLLSRAKHARSGPWDCLATLGALWERTCRGGAVAVFEIGAEAARVDLIHWTLCDIAYCRAGMRGVLQGLMDGVQRGVRVDGAHARPGRVPVVSYLVSWGAMAT